MAINAVVSISNFEHCQIGSNYFCFGQFDHIEWKCYKMSDNSYGIQELPKSIKKKQHIQPNSSILIHQIQ